ncbi:MAG TPA: ABC transporter substrate-binding protein [Acidimicrobiia bacterium]|nr:ABC transporter substrate-binding protein [Acidimicrobiia bacterium]
MRRSSVLLAVLLVLPACSAEGGTGTTTAGPSATTTTGATVTTIDLATTMASGFPVTVEADNGSVTIETRPEEIVSLSSTATEMLFAIGAADQIVAVDDQSNYPAEAPITDLSGFTPNIEAILAYQPDLVVIGYEPGELVDTLSAAGVPVLFYNAALTVDDTYRQIEALGRATGHVQEAGAVNESIQTDLENVVAGAPEVPEGTTYYHEVDNTYYTATSSTFIGTLYSLFGLENIADPADADGAAFGYPQLSAEFIVAADPDLIFLADSFYGETPETVAARPGWEVLTAVQEGHVIPLDSDIVSRWGPRIVEFAQAVSDALSGLGDPASG